MKKLKAPKLTIIESSLGYLFLKIIKLFVKQESLSAKDLHTKTIKNILLIIRHLMGDMICATPMMRAVRKYFPDAFITLITKKSTMYKEIFNDNNLVNEVIEYEYGFENFLDVVKKIRKKNYELCIIPSTISFSKTNHLLGYFSNSKLRVGVSSIDGVENQCEFLLNIKKNFLWNKKRIHFIERNLDVIRQININPTDKRIKIEVNNDMKIFADEFYKKNFLETNKIVVGIHPGARKPENIWDVNNYAHIAGKLITKHNASILISEGPSDILLVNKLQNILKNNYNVNKIVRYHGPLKYNFAIICKLNLFITNDTGIMHLASGTDTPMIALFGPTDAYLWGPLGENKISLQSLTNNINDISVEKVYEVCRKLLK